MSQKLDVRQVKLPTAQAMIGTTANDTLDTVFPKINNELAKLFEDRNILLSDGGTITNSAGTSLSFTSNFTVSINSNIAGAAPYVISLGSSPWSFSADGRMAYITVTSRTAATATLTTDASSLPAVTSSNQEIFLIAKRVGTTIYLRNGVGLSSGETINADHNTLSSKQIAYSSSTDSTTTGSNASLQAFTTGIVRLTNASLSSVSGIPAGSSGQILIVENKTGNQITINNEETTPTAANRIQTGSGGSVSMPNNATFAFTYDTTSSRWQLTGGSGSGSGSGGSKNYLSAVTTSQSTSPNTGNGNFESGSTSGWSLGTTGTLTNAIPTGTPTFGSGASGNLSISTVSSSHLAGTYSLSYASSAATTAGNMLASDAFYIDNEDQAKVLGFKFYYKAQTNPSNANWSGTSSNSFGVAVYDVTNSAWLSSTSNFGMTQSSGIGVCSGSFQTASNTTQLRFVVYNANATSGAVTVYFDDFFVGPQIIPQGAAISDWNTNLTFTLTNTGNGTVSARTRRVGDTLFVNGTITMGSTTPTGSITLNMPSGYSIDTSKTTGLHVGAASGSNSGGTSAYTGTIRVDTANTLLFYGDSGANIWNATVPHTWLTSWRIDFTFQVAIVGWSSNVQMSDGYDGRQIAANVVRNSNQTINTSATDIIWDVVGSDETASYNTANGEYTIPSAGWYEFTSNIRIDTGGSAPGQLVFEYVIDGISVIVGAPGDFIGSKSYYFNPQYQAKFKAGQKVKLRITSATNASTLIAGQNGWFIKKLQGPQTIAASESVNAKYTSTAGTSFTDGAAAILDFATKEFDSHAAVTTGGSWKFTAPISGIYSVTGHFGFSIPTSTRYQIVAILRKNGTETNRCVLSTTQNSANTLTGLPFTFMLKLSAGEYIDLQAIQDSGASRTLSTIAGLNAINIAKVGN